ncbi:MAG: hypothetical protein C4582_06295 [Desulfobacteraceae bacterium]|jgi:hypothetical protein|nr:MAG: hypothetical protein C4582_06295 [Desulfobacteraceae bacterium]
MRKKDGKPASPCEQNKCLLMVAVFLVSFSLIGFEIALSRFLSVLLSYHYVFVVLSSALLGLGMGGIIVHFITPSLIIHRNRFIYWGFLYSLAVPLSVSLTILVEYIGNSHVKVAVFGILLVAPFLFAGGLLAELYRRFSSLGNRIYGMDLIGAAVGALGVIVLLDLFGGLRVHLIFGILAFTGCLILISGESGKGRKWILSAVVLTALSIVLGINLFCGNLLEIPVGKNHVKEIYDALFTFKGRIIETRWSSFGRTDLVEYAHLPDQMDIYVDGTAGSPMYRFSGNVNAPGFTVDRLKDEFPGYFPFLNLKEEEKDNALLIGPGGGRDVLIALMGGVRRISAVEINSDQVEMVRKYSHFNGGIYAGAFNVDVVVAEGRSFLKRKSEKYDIIMFSLPVTNTSRSIEGYALSENFLFTVESISDYMDHLTDEGRLIVVAHNDAEILRLLSISLASLDQKGINPVAAMKQIYLVGAEEYPVMVIKKTQFDIETIQKEYLSMVRSGYDKQSSYFPHISNDGMLNPVLMALANGRIGPAAFIKMLVERGYDIRPVSDNSPFFYKFEIGIPRPVLLVFWISAIFSLLAICVPFLFDNLRSDPVRFWHITRHAVLFLFLGIGFMVIEISLIQRFGLFLGNPVLCLAVLLFSILGGAGLGSLWSGRLCFDKIGKNLSMISFLITSIAMVYVFILPLLFDKLLGFDLPIRILISIIILLPLSFLMGFPFPMGIRILKDKGMSNNIPWMWGINGAGSVLGSALTLVIAISKGFNEALLAGASCYLIIFFIFITDKRR